MTIKFSTLVRLLLACAVVSPSVLAQQNAESERPIPVISGNLSFQSTFEPGTTTLAPKLEPLILLPLGNKFLVESEFEMEMDVDHTNSRWGSAVVDHRVEYVQLDYMVHPNLTLTVGRFLTPFGIFRERFDPAWTRNIVADPLIFPMDDNSSNGGMARGNVSLHPGVNLTYAGYFSALSGTSQLEADRRAGGRAAVVLGPKHLELGLSYARVLSGTHYGLIGGDLTWKVPRMPMDVRAEYEQTTLVGKGYWVEAAYHLNRVGRNAFARNSLVALRQEQYWAPRVPQQVLDELPTQNTNATTLGYTYSFYKGLRFDAAYGRNFATGDTHNIWTVGMTYRFIAF